MIWTFYWVITRLKGWRKVKVKVGVGESSKGNGKVKVGDNVLPVNLLPYLVETYPYHLSNLDPTIITCSSYPCLNHYITTFDLWMSWEGFDIDELHQQQVKPCHIMIGIFNIH